MAKQPTTKSTGPTIDKSPIHLLHRVGQCATDVFQSELNDADLTPRQFAVLASLAKHEGASQTDLVDMTGIDRSTLADIVRRMLKKGLVQRKRTKEDARAYAVKLTADGTRALKQAGPLVSKVDDKILAAVPASNRRAFLSALENIVASLGVEEEPVAKKRAAPAKAAPKARAKPAAAAKKPVKAKPKAKPKAAPKKKTARK
ncbi:MAG: MarR family winged helix-turn-helix transcriptional regulator [Pseudomonadota bacterium]